MRSAVHVSYIIFEGGCGDDVDVVNALVGWSDGVVERVWMGKILGSESSLTGQFQVESVT